MLTQITTRLLIDIFLSLIPFFLSVALSYLISSFWIYSSLSQTFCSNDKIFHPCDTIMIISSITFICCLWNTFCATKQTQNVMWKQYSPQRHKQAILLRCIKCDLWQSRKPNTQSVFFSCYISGRFISKLMKFVQCYLTEQKAPAVD